MNIGKKLKEARTAVNLTQEELAEKIHISRQSISSWENGRSYPDILSVILLSDLYGISLDVLLKGDEKMMADIAKNLNSKRRLYIRERALNKSREFNIIDSLGNTEYHVEEVGFLPTPRFYHVKDKNDDLICKIVKKRFHGINLPRYFIKTKGYKEVSLIMDIQNLKKTFYIKGEDMSINGKWLSKNFEVCKSGEVVARVRAEKNNYEVEIIDISLEKLTICFMIGMSFVHDNLNYVME